MMLRFGLNAASLLQGLASRQIGFSYLPCSFVKSRLLQLQTMGTQTIQDDGWKLIADDTCPPYMQPTINAKLLSRPQHAIQPQFPALRSVTAIPSTGDPSSIRSGLQLIVAGLSGESLHQGPAFAPVHRNSVYHVSQVSSPHARVMREDYHPGSLKCFSLDDTIGVSPLAPAHPEGNVLCPGTANGLPGPPLKKDGISRRVRIGVRISKEIQSMRSKLTSKSSVVLDKFEHLLSIFGDLAEVYKSLVSSPFAAEHRKRLFNSYAATTVLRYVQTVQQLMTVMLGFSRDMHNWSESQLVGIFTVMQLSKSCDTDKDVPSGIFFAPTP